MVTCRTSGQGISSLTPLSQRRTIASAMTDHLHIRDAYDSLEPEGIPFAWRFLVT